LISANADAGSILDINAGIMDVDVQGAYTLDATGVNILADGASSFKTSGANALVIDAQGSDLTLDGHSGVNIIGNAAEVDITTSAALDLNSGAGTWNASTMALDSSSTMTITPVGAFNLNGAAGVTIDSAAVMTLGGTQIAATADAAAGMQLITSHADGEIVLQSAHTAGRALFVDANADNGSIVDIDAGILQIDAAGVAGINSGGTLSLGTANNGVAVNIGNAVSEVTIGDNLIVTGDLTVNGATVTLDTTNLLVEDPIIVMNKAAGSANSQGGIAIEKGGTSLDMVLGRVDNDTWGVGTKDTTGGTVTSVHDMTLGAFRSSKNEIGSNANYMNKSGNNLQVVASHDFVVDAAGDIELNADGDQIKLKFGGAAGWLEAYNHGDGHVSLSNRAANKDFFIRGDDNTEIMRFVGDGSYVQMPQDKGIYWNDQQEGIYGNGTNLVLKSGDDLFTLPGVQSAGNQYLVADASGNFTWTTVGAGAAVRNQNIKTTLPVTLASGSQMDHYDPTMNIVPDVSITDSDLDKSMQVFVNGQLLMTGTVGEVGTSSADYHLVESGKSPTATITFDGTTGDVINNYANGGDGNFELLWFYSEGDWVRVNDGGAAIVSLAESNGANNITMDGAADNIGIGSVVGYLSSTGWHFNRVNSLSGNDINLTGTVQGNIAADSKIYKVGESARFLFDNDANITGTGTVAGGQTKICLGTGLSPALGQDGSAEQAAIQTAAAINKAFEETNAVEAKANGLVVSLTAAGLFSSAANGVTLLNAVNNFANSPFAGAGWVSGADVGSKSIKFGFGLELDDVIQVSIR